VRYQRTLRRTSAVPSERWRAEGKEVTEENLGFPLFVYRSEAAAEWQPKEGEVTEGNLGSPLFVYSLPEVTALTSSGR